jgi:hypothetical protein
MFLIRWNTVMFCPESSNVPAGVLRHTRNDAVAGAVAGLEDAAKFPLNRPKYFGVASPVAITTAVVSADGAGYSTRKPPPPRPIPQDPGIGPTKDPASGAPIIFTLRGVVQRYASPNVFAAIGRAPLTKYRAEPVAFGLLAWRIPATGFERKLITAYGGMASPDTFRNLNAYCGSAGALEYVGSTIDGIQSGLVQISH